MMETLSNPREPRPRQHLTDMRGPFLTPRYAPAPPLRVLATLVLVRECGRLVPKIIDTNINVGLVQPSLKQPRMT